MPSAIKLLVRRLGADRFRFDVTYIWKVYPENFTVESGILCGLIPPAKGFEFAAGGVSGSCGNAGRQEARMALVASASELRDGLGIPSAQAVLSSN